ncbi:MAG: DUF1097 domain-containing protein [Mesorhizobium sp.]|nr:MAG: DUF1097 domain-containing protein [Mesorhizobium sp.]
MFQIEQGGGKIMSSFQIAAVVVGLTAALIVGAFLTVGGVLIWAVFLGWASFAAVGTIGPQASMSRRTRSGALSAGCSPFWR